MSEMTVFRTERWQISSMLYFSWIVKEIKDALKCLKGLLAIMSSEETWNG